MKLSLAYTGSCIGKKKFSDFVYVVFQVPNGIGVILGSTQLLLFVFYPSTSQRTITYSMKSKPAKPV